MDPAFINFAQQYFIIDNMTIKLIGIGYQDEYTNELAQSVEFSEDKKTIYIELKKAKFSDGSYIKAIDVAKSLKRAILLGSPHTNIEDLWLGSENLKTINDEIAGIKVIDDFKLILKLTREAKEILYFLSMADLGILHSSQYNKTLLTGDDWTRISSGPYVGALDQNKKLKLISNQYFMTENKDRPKVVLFNNLNGKDLHNALISNTLDLGFITFNDYLKYENLITEKDFTILGEEYDALTFINLNSSSKKFKDPKVRRKVLKAIQIHFDIDKNLKKAAAKATQFFLPDALGYVDDKKVLDKIISLEVSPIELKNLLGDKFIIEGIVGMKNYVPSNLDQKLSNALGTNVIVNLVVPNNKSTEKFLINRSFDAYIIAVGMTRKVLGEAMNLQYLSRHPALLDPTGKIKELLKKYQQQEKISAESELISQIILQMIEDAELVPLYYFSSPFILNNKTIQSTKLNLRESADFATIKMN